MHVSELTAEERDSFDRAMATIESMDDADRRQILEHAVASSIRYATERQDETLRDWTRSLLASLRAGASPEYRSAVKSHHPPARPIRGVTAKELISRLSYR